MQEKNISKSHSRRIQYKYLQVSTLHIAEKAIYGAYRMYKFGQGLFFHQNKENKKPEIGAGVLADFDALDFDPPVKIR